MLPSNDSDEGSGCCFLVVRVRQCYKESRLGDEDRKLCTPSPQTMKQASGNKPKALNPARVETCRLDPPALQVRESKPDRFVTAGFEQLLRSNLGLRPSGPRHAAAVALMIPSRRKAWDSRA